MKNNLFDVRRIELYVDEQKNITIFPISMIESDNDIKYTTSKVFFELKTPYSIAELAVLIEKGIDSYCKYEPYNNSIITIEEYYYNINGFKNATLGKKLISLGWDDISGKYVSVSLPVKRGKYYLGIKSERLSDEADWNDFADAVIRLVNMDLSEVSSFKTYKKKLNL